MTQNQTDRPKVLDPAPNAPLEKIRWRIDGKPTRTGKVRVVPYLDPMHILEMLDAWAGVGGWSDRYEIQTVNGQSVITCGISVQIGDQWVERWDGAAPTHYEAEKGGLTDAFKRCASRKWGIGRNVYELNTLFISEFETFEARGKTHARLTPKSHAEIRRLLKGKGHNEAADAAEIDDSEVELEQNGTEAPQNAGGDQSGGDPVTNQQLAQISQLARKIYGQDGILRLQEEHLGPDQRINNITAEQAEALITALKETPENEEAAETAAPSDNGRSKQKSRSRS